MDRSASTTWPRTKQAGEFLSSVRAALKWLTTRAQGVGIAFGPDVTKRWCTENGVTGVIRSHEVRQGASSVPLRREDADKPFVTFLYFTLPDGYEIEHDGLCTTVFSAPNYVDQVGNKGAFVSNPPS